MWFVVLLLRHSYWLLFTPIYNIYFFSIFLFTNGNRAPQNTLLYYVRRSRQTISKKKKKQKRNTSNVETNSYYYDYCVDEKAIAITFQTLFVSFVRSSCTFQLTLNTESQSPGHQHQIHRFCFRTI